MNLINDADPRRTFLRILIAPARFCAGLTCGKQDAQVAHDRRDGADNPRNPARSRLRRVPPRGTCIPIKAA